MSDAYYLGRKYLEEGECEGAVAQFEFALLENKYDWKSYFHLAESCLQLGREREDCDTILRGYQALESLHALNPDFMKRKVRNLQEEIISSLEEHGLSMVDERAIAESVIASDPHEANAHHQISNSLNEGPRTRILRFQKIIEADPANLIALSQLAKAYEERGEYIAARRAYERLIKFALSMEIDLYTSEENLSSAVRWWADNAETTGQANRETLELMSALSRLARIVNNAGEVANAALLYAGTIDLGINTQNLVSIKHVFNEFLSACVQSGKYELTRGRFSRIQEFLAKEEEGDFLDPVLASLVQTRHLEEDRGF